MEGQSAPPPRQRPTPMEKRIYGVPVFPGPSTAAQPVLNNPVPAQSPRSPAVQAVRPPQALNDQPSQEPDPNALKRRSVVSASASMGSLAQASVTSSVMSPTVEEKTRWKLRHVDFMPALIKSKKDEDYERFQMLVERANLWSNENPQCLVFCCETVTWSAVDRTIFSDSGILQKSMTSDKKTRYLRGLRVWYFIYDETFYDKKTSPGPFKLGCVNYICEGKNDNLVTLLSKMNADMFKRTVAGKIIKVETLMMLSDVGDADVCSWSEQPDKSRDYTYFIRLFYIFKKEGMEDCKYGNIGIRDFTPSCDQRTPHNQGYETFSDLWQKAARWVYTSPDLKLINVQGLFVKVKKEKRIHRSFEDLIRQHKAIKTFKSEKSEGQSNPNLWDRCTHKEHASAYGSLSHQKTEYYQILRLVYHQPVGGGGSAGGGVTQNGHQADSRKFSYKCFTPSTLKRAAAPSMSDADQEPMPAESLFEDIRQLEDKMNAWLHHAEAKIASVETVSTRLFTGGQEMLGPEATYVYNDREKNQSRENWRVNVRLYIEGDYRDPPAEWRNCYNEKSISITSGLKQATL